LASLGVGTYFGIHTLDLRDEARRTCPSSPCNDRTAVRTNDQAKTSATIATATLASGGGLFLLGSILFFSAPSATPKPSIGVAVTPSSAGVGVGGSF
jgi:hypothetical protein